MPKLEAQTKRAPGRPRSETSRRAILDAAMTLLDNHSVREITIEAIAREAGVGKVTIYRWWPTKARLMVDAFMENVAPLTPMPKSGAKLTDLAVHVTAVVREYQGKFGRIVAEIIAEGQFEKDTFDYFREALISNRRASAKRIVEEAKSRGEIRVDMDTDLLLDLLYGPIYYRLMVGHKPLDQDFAENIARLVMAISEIPAPRGRKK